MITKDMTFREVIAVFLDDKNCDSRPYCKGCPINSTESLDPEKDICAIISNFRYDLIMKNLIKQEPDNSRETYHKDRNTKPYNCPKCTATTCDKCAEKD